MRKRAVRRIGRRAFSPLSICKPRGDLPEAPGESPHCAPSLHGAFMRVLLSTIGSRGDVQPLVALGQALTSLGVEVRLCVPPDFREWIEELGMAVVPIGPELSPTGKGSFSPASITPEQRRQMIEGTVATQFRTIASAAQDCDVIVGATALQIAAPS